MASGTRVYTIDTAFTSERIYKSFTGDMTLLNALIGGSLALEQASSNTPLTQWVGDYWGNPRMTPAQAMVILGVTNQTPVANLQPGDPNPFFRFIDDITKTGNVINRGSSVTTLQMINDDDLTWMKGDTGRAMLLCSLPQGDVDGLEVNFVIPEDDYEDEIPVGFPYSSTTENDIVRQLKWSEWKDATHQDAHALISGNYYIPSNSNTGGRLLRAKEWFSFALAGLSVVIDKPTVEVEP
jgi:hypothetical protein